MGGDIPDGTGWYIRIIKISGVPLFPFYCTAFSGEERSLRIVLQSVPHKAENVSSLDEVGDLASLKIPFAEISAACATFDSRTIITKEFQVYSTRFVNRGIKIELVATKVSFNF